MNQDKHGFTAATYSVGTCIYRSVAEAQVDYGVHEAEDALAESRIRIDPAPGGHGHWCEGRWFEDIEPFQEGLTEAINPWTSKGPFKVGKRVGTLHDLQLFDYPDPEGHGNSVLAVRGNTAVTQCVTSEGCRTYLIKRNEIPSYAQVKL